VIDGGAATERTLNVKRTGMTLTGFQIGDMSTPGNVQAGARSDDAGGLHRQGQLEFNVADYTVTAGPTMIENGAHSSPTPRLRQRPDRCGNLTLNNFVLNINRAASWPNHYDLILFTYSGTLTGTPSVTFGSVPAEFTYCAAPDERRQREADRRHAAGARRRRRAAHGSRGMVAETPLDLGR
jgi:hypothetical protein